MLSPATSFVKASGRYQTHLKRLLKKAGFRDSTILAAVCAVDGIGEWLWHGCYLSTTLAWIAEHLEMSSSAVSRTLRALSAAKILERTNKGRGGIVLRLLVRPEDAPARLEEPPRFVSEPSKKAAKKPRVATLPKLEITSDEIVGDLADINEPFDDPEDFFCREMEDLFPDVRQEFVAAPPVVPTPQIAAPQPAAPQPAPVLPTLIEEKSKAAEEAVPAKAEESADERKARAIEIRLDEQAAQGGFTKSRAHLRNHLKTAMKPDEIAEALAREQERLDAAAKIEAKRQAEAELKALQHRKSKAIDEHLKAMSKTDLAALEARAEQRLSPVFQRVSKANPHRLERLEEIKREIVKKALEASAARDPIS